MTERNEDGVAKCQTPQLMSKWPAVKVEPYDKPSDGSTLKLSSEPVGMAGSQVVAWSHFQVKR